MYDPTAPSWLRAIPAVETLRQIWVQQFYVEADALRWRTEQEGIPPSARFISSPYDLDAHLGKKGTTAWIGYKVHITETCDEDAPRLLTNVETSSAPTADGAMTPEIHEALKDKDLLPERHIVDTGYLDAELLVTSQQDYDVDLLGPTRQDRRWQSRAAEGFGMADFVVDFERHKASCPEGHESVEWMPRIDNRGNDTISIRFSPSDCNPCASRAMCTRSDGKYVRRSISVRPEDQYVALRAARERQKTDAFKEAYALRAGIEGTLSQGVRAFGLRRCRYRGADRTHLQHVLTAAAINFVRVDRWLMDVPLAQTRRSPFITLMKTAA
jgi:transposase